MFGSVRDVVRLDWRATTLRPPVVAARAVFVEVRCTTRRVVDEVAVPVVFVCVFFAVRGTTRRAGAIRFVLTTISIGLFVWLTVVPGFKSVRILLDKYGYMYA